VDILVNNAGTWVTQAWLAHTDEAWTAGVLHQTSTALSVFEGLCCQE